MTPSRIPLSPGASSRLWKRREFVQTAVAGVALAHLPTGLAATLSGSTEKDAVFLRLRDSTGLTIDGPHRFCSIAGQTGLHVTSLHTQARFATAMHHAPQGTLTFWFSPLEDLTSSPGNSSDTKVPFEFPFVADVFPGRDSRLSSFGVSLLNGYPALVARFTAGRTFPKLDYGLAPFVYAEKVVLRRGYWYHFALAWDRSALRLRLWLNGFMAGHNDRAVPFDPSAAHLFLGNPMMVMRDLRIEDHALDDAAVRARYRSDRPPENDLPDADFRRLLEPSFLAPLDLRRDAAWKLAYETEFTRARDAAAWIRQGPAAQFLSDFRMETTSEGLLLKTPDVIERETRMYLWSPKSFEGDQWIEFDFRLESPAGLALVSACASGMQREDFLLDHGVPKTGAMATILRDVRNYHWEFMRRVEAMRTDVETQYVSKNPFGHKLHCACVPRLEQNRWYRLRLIVADRRLHGSFDGQTVFDHVDSAFQNNGPVYNFGRLGLRHMYRTSLRYRNLSVYERRA